MDKREIETEVEKGVEQYVDWLALDVLGNEEAWAAFVGMLEQRKKKLDNEDGCPA